MAARQRPPLDGNDDTPAGAAATKPASVKELDKRVREKTFELAVAEEALEVERQRTLNLLDQLPHFVCVLARDFSIRFANHSFQNLFGHNGGKHCFEKMHGLPEPCEGCPITEVVGEGVSVTRKWHAQDGRIYEVFHYPFQELDGTPRMLKLGIDITNRIHAENELKLERDRFQGILNSMMDGIYIVNQNNDVLYSNLALEQDFGHPDGRKCYAYLHDRQRPCSWCNVKQIVPGKAERREWHSEKTGKTYDLLGTAIRNTDGTLSKLQIIRDITERKRVEDSLRASEDRYRMLVETMNEGLGVVDEHETIKYVNDRLCDLLQYRKEELIGRSAKDFLDDGNRRRLEERLAVRREGVDRPYELTWTRKDGKKVPTIVSPKTIKAGDRIFGAIAVVTDITERLTAEAAMKESARQLRSLSAQLLRAQDEERSRISRELHDELGQSLSVLKLRVGLIRKQLRPEQDTTRDDCDETLQYLNQVIENVRRLSRDLSPSILEDLGLSTALRRLLTQFSQLGPCEVSWKIGEVDKGLSADGKITLYRVFQEALTNIQKHSQAKKVAVSVEQRDDMIDCCIEDDGVGLPAKASTCQEPENKGMGLAIMSERVRMLGGTIDIRSETARGTRIAFSFPAQSAEVR